MRAFEFAVAILFSLAFTHPASATLITITYGGNVEGFDNFTAFTGSTSGGEITGRFTLTFKFDTDLAGAGGYIDTGSISQLFGGQSFGLPAVGLGVALSTEHGGGSWFGQYAASDTSRSGSSSQLVVDKLLGRYGPEFPSINVSVSDPLIPESLTAPFSISGSEIFGGGSFSYSEGTRGGASGQLSIDSMSVTVAAVPEASTWAMLLIGFAGIGFVSYLRSANNLIVRTA